MEATSSEAGWEDSNQDLDLQEPEEGEESSSSVEQQEKEQDQDQQQHQERAVELMQAVKDQVNTWTNKLNSCLYLCLYQNVFV